MTPMRFQKHFLATLFYSCIAVVSAQATNVDVTSGMVSGEIGAASISFDDGLPANFTASGDAGTMIGSATLALAPDGDDSRYAYVGAASSITAMFPEGIDYLGVYWGSPDPYNSVSLRRATGEVETFGSGGGSIAGLVFGQASQFVNFHNDGASPWTSVTFSSEGFALEFDNLATSRAAGGAAAPEPPPFILMLFGCALVLGAELMRRRLNVVGATL